VLVDVLILMKRKFKQRLATIPPIPTKRTIPFHPISLNMKKTSTYVVGNPGPGLGHSLVLNFNQCLVIGGMVANLCLNFLFINIRTSTSTQTEISFNIISSNKIIT
jgi:hypothetical protein